MAQERLQKVIARAGLASRRAAEELISSSRVRVNGAVVTQLGTRVDPRADKIEVDGRRIVAEVPVYLVLHKPRAVVSTLRDPEGRSTVGELVSGVGARVFPVGRLDYHTSGVLLLTNDGEFCDALLHPRRDVPKTYVVKVGGEMAERDRERWEQGVELEDGKTRPAEVRILRREQGKTWLEVTLFEGRNQQIRRMGEATGFPVMRLARTSFAGISSEGLRPGVSRELTHEELLDLRTAYGVPRRIRGARPQGPPTKSSERPEPRPGREHSHAGKRSNARQRAGRASVWTGKERKGARERPNAKATDAPARKDNVAAGAARRGGRLTSGPPARTRRRGG
jgi:23S rRNA pseudouridine2605 synthase